MTKTDKLYPSDITKSNALYRYQLDLYIVVIGMLILPELPFREVYNGTTIH